MRTPITLPLTLPATVAGICERCAVHSRVRAVRTDAGVGQLCTNCHPTESEPEGNTA